MQNSAKFNRQTDTLLIEQITINNDYKAFQTLFHKYYATLCQQAYMLTQSSDIAEEIVSDVFLKIWRNRETLQIKISILAYLMKATRNASIDYLRQKTRQRAYNHDIEGDFTSDYASPTDMMIGDETLTIIEKAIEALPPQCKLIFRMSRDAEMTYTEIATKLNLSIKTIETHMGRSLKFLRESLRQQAVLG